MVKYLILRNMPKGVPNKQHTLEFKQQVAETMQKEEPPGAMPGGFSLSKKLSECRAFSHACGKIKSG